MTLILGVDPGAHGALVLLDSSTGRVVHVEDMPTWRQQVGRTVRERVDGMRLSEIIDTFRMMGGTLAVLEDVQGFGKQPGHSMFTFGYGVGLIYMALLYNGFAIEQTAPATWKRLMNVPGKNKADDSAILKRAYELFPDDRHLFTGPRGGARIDRAEAAMLARFGAEFVLKETATIARLTADFTIKGRKAK